MSTETTIPTTEPPPDVAVVSPDAVAVREAGPEFVPPEGQCFVPADRWQEFLLTYVPCELLEEPEITVAVGQPPVVAQTLPETGAALDIAFIAGVCMIVGGVLLWIKRRGPEDQ